VDQQAILGQVLKDNYFIKGPSTGGTEAFVRPTKHSKYFQKTII
jgi:hypothetical protein